MARRRILEVEIEAIDGRVTIFRVAGYGACELFVYRGPEDRRWHATAPAPVLDGCRVPETWRDGLPPLPAIIEGAFPALVRREGRTQ